MTSKRKLEEEIARNTDPVMRKQLQELLDARNQRWSQKKRNTFDFINNASEGLGKASEELGKGLIIGAIIAIIVGIIIVIVLIS
jgi:hypothetical protein